MSVDWLFLHQKPPHGNHHLIDQTARTLPEQRDEAKMRDSYKGRFTIVLVPLC